MKEEKEGRWNANKWGGEEEGRLEEEKRGVGIRG